MLPTMADPASTPVWKSGAVIAALIAAVAALIPFVYSRCCTPQPTGLLTVTWEGTAADQLNMYSNPNGLNCQPLRGRRECSATYKIGERVTIRPDVKLDGGRPGSDSQFIWTGDCEQSAAPLLNEASVTVSQKSTCHLKVDLNQH